MKFNFLKKRPRADTVNLAGGEAFTETPKLELASLMLTSMLKDEFYRGGDATAQRLRTLISAQQDKRFVAQAALYARKEAGMRSVSHLAAAELAKSVKGQPWTARFYDRVVHRPDDAIEILACYRGAHGKTIPNSLKKGLGRALARFDEYQLAKYRKERAEFSLVDVVNLVHPPATEDCVIPYAVGVDIACRMRLTVYDRKANIIAGQKDRLANILESETKFGVGGTFKEKRQHDVLDEDWDVSPITRRFMSLNRPIHPPPGIKNLATLFIFLK